MKKIFLSYSWAKSNEANEVDTTLNQFDLKVIRDVRDLKQMANIPEFMERIKDSDFAVLLVSDSYIKSKNCLYEVIKLLEDVNFTTKAVPLIFSDAKISSTLERLNYMNYWESQIEQLQNGINTGLSSVAFASNIIKDLEHFQLIRTNLDKLFNFLTEHLYFNYEQESKNSFKNLLTHIGVSNNSAKTKFKPRDTIDRFNLKNSNGVNNILDIYRLLLNISYNAEIELPRIMGHLQEITNNLAKYFTNKTKSECAVSIKLITNDETGKNPSVLTLVRDTESLSRYSEIDKIKARIEDNTVYKHIVQSMPATNPYFLSNDLRGERNYENTSFNIRGNLEFANLGNFKSFLRKKSWPLPYLSVMSVPVFNGTDKNDKTIIGFLNVDSSKEHVFKSEEDIKIVKDIGEQLFFALHKFQAFEINE